MIWLVFGSFVVEGIEELFGELKFGHVGGTTLFFETSEVVKESKGCQIAKGRRR